MVWIQIRTDILSVLIWVQTVCKGYQQTTKVAARKERVKTITGYCVYQNIKDQCLLKFGKINYIPIIIMKLD